MALADLQQVMSAGSFDAWVKNARAVGMTGSSLTIAAPSTFAQEWLEHRLREQIEGVLTRLRGRRTELNVVVTAFQAPRTGGRAARAGANRGRLAP